MVKKGFSAELTLRKLLVRKLWSRCSAESTANAEALGLQKGVEGSGWHKQDIGA